MSKSELHTLLSSKRQQRSYMSSKKVSDFLNNSSMLSNFQKTLIRAHRRTDNRSFSITRRTITRFRSKLLLLDAQIFFALILLIQSPDLLTMNGTYFYFLGFFDGGGWFFFTIHVSLCISCLVSSALLYIGSRCQMPTLIIPHVFWQFLFIIVSFLAIVVLMLLGLSGNMLLPSSIVLSSMMGVADEDTLCARDSLV
ncbi:hypothetical protein CAEBREN_30354 [Caenorhabditis brenneri]|uniref:Uncharacterized protein n=1 Tax=Caenorhabditis brenneri TaxID=135651 RepID=G0NKN3_CAEBE|nr:hypothetical protein CAEBREN_30354 [Caenorhabditis brenneri]